MITKEKRKYRYRKKRNVKVKIIRRKKKIKVNENDPESERYIKRVLIYGTLFLIIIPGLLFLADILNLHYIGVNLYTAGAYVSWSFGLIFMYFQKEALDLVAKASSDDLDSLKDLLFNTFIVIGIIGYIFTTTYDFASEKAPVTNLDYALNAMYALRESVLTFVMFATCKFIKK